MPRELKNAKEIKAYFQTEAAKIIGEVAGEPFRTFENTREFEVMTKYGRMQASTHDTFIACRFDRRNLASSILSGMSSKWNHHAFHIGTVGHGFDYVNRVLEQFKKEFSRIEPRKWETHDVQITEDYLKETGIEKLRDREALGERFVIEGFNQVEAAAEMVAEVTDTHGERPDWLINSVRDKLASESPLEVYDSYRKWREINPKADETPAMRM